MEQPDIDTVEMDEAAVCPVKNMGEDTSAESTSSGQEDDITVLTWDVDDRENPYNFPKARKRLVVFVAVVTILNATLGSSLPSNVVPKLSEEWGIESTYQKILPISVYIIGINPMFW